MDGLPWLTPVADIASIAGLIFSWLAFRYAKSADTAARQARAEVRRANATEILGYLSKTAESFQTALENKNPHEAVVRARDLFSNLSAFKDRYDRFVGLDSKVRFDEAREQVSVISGQHSRDRRQELRVI